MYLSLIRTFAMQPPCYFKRNNKCFALSHFHSISRFTWLSQIFFCSVLPESGPNIGPPLAFGYIILWEVQFEYWFQMSVEMFIFSIFNFRILFFPLLDSILLIFWMCKTFPWFKNLKYVRSNTQKIFASILYILLLHSVTVPINSDFYR